MPLPPEGTARNSGNVKTLFITRIVSFTDNHNVRNVIILKITQRGLRKPATLPNKNRPNPIGKKTDISERTKNRTLHKRKQIEKKNAVKVFSFCEMSSKIAKSSFLPPHRINPKTRGGERRRRMVANRTESASLNSSQPACSLLGNYSWREEYLNPTNFILLVITVSAESIMIPLTVLSNALVIFLVWRKRYLRKQKPCVLLACLAATDLLVGSELLPLLVTGHALRLSRMTPVCLIDTAILASINVFCGASLFHLVIISGERYVAIKHSFHYETLVTSRRITAAVAIAWAIPVVALGTLIMAELTSYAELTQRIFSAILLLSIPGSLAAIFFCQIVVFLESRRHRQHILAHQVSEAAVKEILKKDKAARTTTMVVGALLLCYTPATLCHVVTSTASFPADAALGAIYVAEVFAFANSLVNPIIYCMRTHEFKRSLKELFGREIPQVNPQAAGNPSTVERRRIGQTHRPFSGGKQQKVHPPNRAPARSSRSRSLDWSRDYGKERGNRRKYSA